MKKLLMATGAILLVCLGLVFWNRALNPDQNSGGNKNITIYNWGDYLDPALIKKFEQKTGYRVTYETFDSNEAMYTKINQGGTSYDLAVPSEYMIEKMKKAKLLERIDKSKISNFKEIDPLFLHKSFDKKNNFSVPYFWGTLGIVYNDQMIKPGQLKHWNDLWQTNLRNKVLLVDSARDIMGLSLISLNYSMNATNHVQLKLAQTKLNELGANVKAIVADELKMYMIQNEAAVGVTWSGEASEMMAANKHIHYVVPSEGSNLWFDNMVIPKTVKNKAGAYAFINFMLQPKNAAQNAEYIGYATPVKKAKTLLPKKISSDKQFYPSLKTMKKLEVYRDLGQKVVQDYNDLFLEFKMYAR